MSCCGWRPKERSPSLAPGPFSFHIWLFFLPYYYSFHRWQTRARRWRIVRSCGGGLGGRRLLMAAETGSAADGLMAAETGSAVDGLVAHVFTMSSNAIMRFWEIFEGKSEIQSRETTR